MRKFNLETHYLFNEKASCMISMGNTKVLTVATLQKRVPPFLDPEQSGWLTAEYNMLPRSSNFRVNRDRNKPNKRNIEIERLIGRALRNSVDLSLIPGYTIMIDADVIQADGGTRTASINGGMVCTAILIQEMLKNKLIEKNPIKYFIGAISVGIINKKIILDIDYEKDSIAEVDMNIIMNENGKLIEIQGTGEHGVFSVSTMNKMVKIAQKGILDIIKKEKKIIKYG